MNENKYENQFEFINLLFVRERLPFIQEYYSNPATVISVFRFISPLAKQFILRMLRLKDHSLPLKVFKIWTNTSTEQNKQTFQNALQELQDKEILKIKEQDPKIPKKENESKSYLNIYFANELKEIFDKGYQVPFVIDPNFQLCQNFNHEVKQYARKKWIQIHELIIGMVNKSNIDRNSNLYKVLVQAHLIPKDFHTGSITKEGFQFILSPTCNQVNILISEYTKFWIQRGEPAEMIINFIFNLNQCLPEQGFYTKYKETKKNQKLLKQFTNYQFNKIQMEIIEDFKIMGLIYQQQNNNDLYYATYLIWNFTYDSSQIDVDFKADLLVETNFRIYAYTISEFILRLLEHFCVINYQFPNFIIATLSKESVQKAFLNNITSDQLINFLNKNIDPQKIKKMTENTKRKTVYRSVDEDQGRKLNFLRLFQKEPESEQKSSVCIPDNVMQQLKLWDKEKEMKYSEESINELAHIK